MNNCKKISILWGSWPEEGQKADTYTFKTHGELTAFVLGVEEGNGWNDYSVVKEGYVYKEGDEYE